MSLKMTLISPYDGLGSPNLSECFKALTWQTLTRVLELYIQNQAHQTSCTISTVAAFEQSKLLQDPFTVQVLRNSNCVLPPQRNKQKETVLSLSYICMYMLAQCSSEQQLSNAASTCVYNTSATNKLLNLSLWRLTNNFGQNNVFRISVLKKNVKNK